MAGVRKRVVPFPIFRCIFDAFVYRVGNDDASERQITAGYALGECDYVRYDVPVGKAEPMTYATKSSDDFVSDKKDIIFRTNFTNPGPVVIGGYNNPRCTLNRFSDEGSNCFGAFT